MPSSSDIWSACGWGVSCERHTRLDNGFQLAVHEFEAVAFPFELLAQSACLDFEDLSELVYLICFVPYDGVKYLAIGTATM